MGPCILDELAYPLDVMRARIIQNHVLPRLQQRTQELLQEIQKHRTVQRPFKTQRSRQALRG